MGVPSNSSTTSSNDFGMIPKLSLKLLLPAYTKGFITMVKNKLQDKYSKVSTKSECRPIQYCDESHSATLCDCKIYVFSKLV